MGYIGRQSCWIKLLSGGAGQFNRAANYTGGYHDNYTDRCRHTSYWPRELCFIGIAAYFLFLGTQESIAMASDIFKSLRDRMRCGCVVSASVQIPVLDEMSNRKSTTKTEKKLLKAYLRNLRLTDKGYKLNGQ